MVLASSNRRRGHARLASMWLRSSLVLLGAGCGSSSVGSDPVVEQAQALSTVQIFGQIETAAGVPIAGVSVHLTGSQTQTVISDAIGTYAFQVPAGTYAVSASKPGATLTPSSAQLTVTADKAQDFACDAACGSGSLAPISPLKELVIVDPTVVSDARASNATDGPWSFRFLMEQMTPAGMDPADFAGEWTQGFTQTSMNGFAMSTRILGNLTNNWPKRADGKLDLSQAPFQLLAIVNRVDVHSNGNGEGRLVFGMTIPAPPPLPPSGNRFTVIFEYELPTTSQKPNRLAWVTAFHALGALPFGSSYNASLQAVTDQFVRAGAVPVTSGNPTGSALGQLRTNEVVMNLPWTLREFHLYATAPNHVFLKPAGPVQSPDLSLNDNFDLAQFLTANRTNVLLARQLIPGSLPNGRALIGGESLESNDPSGQIKWLFEGMDESLRHAFAGQTCDGCHNGETAQLDTFYLISPIENAPPGSDGTARLSPFVTQVEIPRRASFMQTRLACPPGTACAMGAEVAAPPSPPGF
jgi:hypothetical protein